MSAHGPNANAPVSATLDVLTMPLQGLQVIEASAGTGKTWTLAALYVRLVLGHGSAGGAAAGLYPPQILVMTFTDAATAELRGRVRERLAQSARFFARSAPDDGQDADDFLRKLRAAYAPELWPDCAYRLDMAAQWMDDAAIFTIHGWSSRMLKSHAFDSASLFQQSRVQDSERLRLLAAQDYWRKWFYPLPLAQLDALKPLGQDPVQLLEKLQQRWALADKGPGGARYAGEPPDRLLQRWAAWQQATEVLQAQARTAWTDEAVALVHDAIARKQLKGYASNHLPGWLKLMAAWQQGDVIKLDTLERFSVSALTGKGWSQSADRPAFAHIDALCAQLRLEPNVADDLLAHAAQEIGTAYRQAKAELAQFDFSDLLQCLYHALQAPDGRLASAIRGQFPVALVDEFQDTDPWQYGALARIYADPGAAGTGLIMIGDPKQAIYSFRGADLDTYLLARGQAQAIHTLSGNFRSSKEVVAAVNHVFGLVPSPFGAVPFVPVQACNEQVLPLQNGAQQQPAMTVWYAAASRAPRKALGMRAMAEVFATQMVGLLNAGAARPGDMAVLVRDGHQARAMRAALAQRGVRSVYLSERDSVYATAEATDLWRVLRAVAFPRHTQWVRAALATRLWGLDWDALESLFQDEEGWDAVVDQFHGWQGIWQRQGLLPLLHRLLHDQSIPARLLDPNGDEGHGGERRLTNLLHLGDLLQTASQGLQGEGALIRYLEEQLHQPKASGDTAQLRLESDADLVQVVTVHKAKGLQYPLVFLPFASQFRPEKKDSARDDELRLAEDLRLLYVALTRAERALWLGAVPVKGDVDGDRPQAKSALSVLLQRRAPGDLPERLQAWSACPDIVVAVAPAPDAARYAPTEAARTFKPVLAPGRLLRSRWWTASFSALTRDLGHGGANTALPSDRDLRLDDAQVDSRAAAAAPELSFTPSAAASPMLRFNAFAAGSRYGTLLHDLLEWQAQRGWPAAQDPPSALAAREWTSLLARKAQRLHLAPEQTALAQEWIAELARARLPVGTQPLVLGQLKPAAFWAEMAFTLPVHQLGASRIDGLIRQHVLPGQARPALQALQLEGMLTGFMDLVLEHGGRYFVLDYKSNLLDGYGAAPLQQSILAHRYDVQYTLYLLALHRLLKSRLPDYDYERHVGGALYLYLRGIDQPGAGLYLDRPALALIEALDAAFAQAPHLPKDPS
jgi:exodeoxyribonuclease V beta subunit